jgi:hypothetical protein
MDSVSTNINAEGRNVRKPILRLLAVLRVTILFAFTFGLAACRPESTESKETCVASAPIKSWATDAASGYKVFVFGETHGTREASTVFLEAVCSVVDSDVVAIVGLEIPESALSIAKEAIHTRYSDELRRELLLGSPFWAMARDGRSSAANFRLLETLVRMEDLGKIRLVGFDRRITGREDFSRTAGDYLMRALEESLRVRGTKEWRMILLTGQNHADFRSGSSSLSDFFPLRGYRTLSIAMLNAGGDAWVCRAGSCGPSPVGPQGGCHLAELAPIEGRPIDRLRSSSRLCLGPVSISPPMVGSSPAK